MRSVVPQHRGEVYEQSVLSTGDAACARGGPFNAQRGQLRRLLALSLFVGCNGPSYPQPLRFVICSCPAPVEQGHEHEVFPIVEQDAVDLLLLVDGGVVQDHPDAVFEGLERLTDQLASTSTDWRVGVLDVAVEADGMGRLRSAAETTWVDAATDEPALVLRRMVPRTTTDALDPDAVFASFVAQPDTAENRGFRRDVPLHVALLADEVLLAADGLLDDPSVVVQLRADRDNADFLERVGVAATGRPERYPLAELPDVEEGLAFKATHMVDGAIVTRWLHVCLDPDSDPDCRVVYELGSNSLRPLRWLPSAGTTVHVEYALREAR